MLTYFNAFISGELNPLLTHIALLGGSIIAEFAVAAGIILESPKTKSFREWLGMALVLGGVSIGAVLTISLFVFDEGISRGQQSKIIALEIRLAPRKIEDPEAMVKKLKPFSGTPFDVSIQPESEPLGMLDQLTNVLTKAGWLWLPAHEPSLQFNALGKPTMGFIILRGGIEVRVSPDRWPVWKDAATALGDTLAAEKLAELAAPGLPANDSAIHISIGTKE